LLNNLGGAARARTGVLSLWPARVLSRASRGDPKGQPRLVDRGRFELPAFCVRSSCSAQIELPTQMRGRGALVGTPEAAAGVIGRNRTGNSRATTERSAVELRPRRQQPDRRVSPLQRTARALGAIDLACHAYSVFKVLSISGQKKKGLALARPFVG
jgi:hypothetical protein